MTNLERTRFGMRWLLAATMVGAGSLHFFFPAPYLAIMPRFLPVPRLLVFISGFFEIAGGLGLLVPLMRLPASLGLVALFLAVFPANINMAVNDVPINGHHFAAWTLWLRLPLQFVLIAWARWVGYVSLDPKARP